MIAIEGNAHGGETVAPGLKVDLDQLAAGARPTTERTRARHHGGRCVYSITSSARASIKGGTVRPIALAVLRCYGASGDEIASIGGLLTDRWHPSAWILNPPMEAIDAQAGTAAQAA